MALVVAALSGAVTLAVVSPGDEGAGAGMAAVEAPSTPLPIAVSSGALVPSTRPEILTPRNDEVLGEWDISMTVRVPKDPLPRRQLTLVILQRGEVVQTLERPRPDDVTVDGVRLVSGTNEITAALQGPDGAIGPQSEPVTVVVDRTPPDLVLTEPEAKTETTETTIQLKGRSEPGATVEIRNRSAGWRDPAVVGPSGEFTASVPLEEGANRIVVISTDPAGAQERGSVRVMRLDGKPVATLFRIGGIKRASLPMEVRIRVDVTDAKGKALADAEVAFTLNVPGQETDGHTLATAANGRAVWSARIPAEGTEAGTGRVTVAVTAPNGEAIRDAVEFPVS